MLLLTHSYNFLAKFCPSISEGLRAGKSKVQVKNGKRKSHETSKAEVDYCFGPENRTTQIICVHGGWILFKDHMLALFLVFLLQSITKCRGKVEQLVNGRKCSRRRQERRTPKSKAGRGLDWQRQRQIAFNI